ncbi:MAG: tRNA dihydrouridine(20/20a) synthase DusA [Albidovulum sp.]
MERKSHHFAPWRMSIAPMMDWTDRHCRYLHRQITSSALLYTEMVTAQAVVHGPRDRLLGFDAAEQPVALQLGGSEPAVLAEAVRVAAGYGYGEVNLNVGCPSDRVKSGCFGAVLMKSPDLVAECLAAMQVDSAVEITVKCRIGVDEQEPAEVLPAFLERVASVGVQRVTIHARKAWLNGLSPKENRMIPPLDYPLVIAMKRAFAGLHISINGGITSVDQARGFLDQGLDGVMIGRAAYHEPWDALSRVDAEIFGGPQAPDPFAVVDLMRPYIARHLEQGGRLHQITRHMLGLFHGRPGARGWRRILSERANLDGAGQEVLDAALAPLCEMA